MPRREPDGLFRGKVPYQFRPGVPTPKPQANKVPEELLVTREHLPLDTRPRMHKPHEMVRVPNYNELYGFNSTIGGWRYTIDASVSGTITAVAGTTVSQAVVLAEPQLLRLSQWPGAINAYLVIRQFGIITVNGNTQSTNVNIPATAGALTVYTGSGTLLSAVVTAAGASNLTLQDGAGNIIGIVPSTSVVGAVINFANAGFATSLIANKSATTPVVTLFYSPTQLSTGASDVVFVDFAGEDISLGEYGTNGGGNQNLTTLISTPISDPSMLTVGTLQVTTSANGLSGNMNWQLGFSYAYLVPQTIPFHLEDRNGMHIGEQGIAKHHSDNH